MVQLSLSRKTMLLTLLAILAMAGAIQGITRVFVLRHVEEMEREDIAARSRHVAHVVALEANAFARAGKDWADWDSLMAFATGTRPDFANREFGYGSLVSADWDAVAVFNSGGSAVWQGMTEPHSKSVVPISKALQSKLEDIFRRTSAPTVKATGGIVQVADKTLLVASLPIRNTEPVPGVVGGRLLFARYIDSAWTERLRDLTVLPVSLHPAGDPALAAVLERQPKSNRQKLAQVTELSSPRYGFGYIQLDTLDGSPGPIVQLTVERRLGPMGHRILRGTLYALAVGGLGLLLASYFIVERELITPLRKLRNAVRRLEEGHHAALSLERADELGELGSGFNRMARTMRERETTLRQAHAELKLILDSTADALCGCTLTGNFRGAPSAMGPKWFGPPAEDQDVAAWLFGNQPTLVEIFRLGLSQVLDDKLPLGVAIDQLPRRFSRGTSHYEIVYRPFREGDDIIGLLLVIKDVTVRMQTEQAEREARELQIAIGNMVRDRGAFDHFVDECESLLQQMHTETELSSRLTHLHTLKGACSIFGLLTFSESCQHLEQQIAVNAEAMNEEALRTLRRSFQSTLSRVRRFAPNLGDKRLSISISDYSNFVELLEKRLGHERLLAEAMRLPLEPGERLLGKLVQHAHRLAHEYDRPIEVEVDDGGVRLVAGSTKLLWSALVHGVKNALEHGIEPSEERTSAGKPPTGKIRFVMREQGHHLAVSIIDDGRGIDWAALQKRAYASRLPSSREDLVELLFTDGISTKAETSQISGRGIGLSAIRATCHALGGTCIVFSGPNDVGTELYCTISMAVATHPPSGTRASESHSRLSAHPSAEPPPDTQMTASPWLRGGQSKL